MAELSRGKTGVRGFSSKEMDFQLMRQLGSTSYGGASAGESLATAARIADGDPASWAAEFSSLGEWQQKAVEQSLDAADRMDRILTAGQREELRRWSW